MMLLIIALTSCGPKDEPINPSEDPSNEVATPTILGNWLLYEFGTEAVQGYIEIKESSY